MQLQQVSPVTNFSKTFPKKISEVILHAAVVSLPCLNQNATKSEKCLHQDSDEMKKESLQKKSFFVFRKFSLKLTLSLVSVPSWPDR